MKPLPFKMRQDSQMEKWRAATFWDKEPETIAWINTFQDDAVFYDIGANIGLYSLYCATTFPKSIVYAFEPHTANWRAIQHNMLINRLTNMAALMAVVSHINGVVGFQEPTNEAGISGSQMMAIEDETTVQIYSASIDMLATTRSAPNHVKIDIDGQELSVVLGMVYSLQSSIQSVLIEVTPESKAIILPIMQTFGYSTNTWLNTELPHSRTRRAREGIEEENIIFYRRV
jgi:FkbM family methyltransferase